MTDNAMHDRARDRLKHLLRDYADAAEEYTNAMPDRAEDGSGSILPGRWHFFAELDHWLRIMRTCTCPTPAEHLNLRRINGSAFKHKPNCTRPLHWQLNERYIRPHARTMLKRHTGKHLPPHSERATHHDRVLPRKDKTQVLAAPFAGTTMIARWHPTVSMTEVNRGLDWLLERMHQGDTTSINLPPDLTGATPEPHKHKPNTEERIAA